MSGAHPRRLWETVLRQAVGLGLLAALFFTTDVRALGGALRHALSSWPWVAAGLVLTFLGLSAGALRWNLILGASGLRLSAAKSFRIFFVGQFFNAFMLGACGGDVARAFLAARETDSRKTEAATTVFIDRAAGLFVVMVFSCAMILCRVPLFLDHKGPRSAGILMLLFLGAATVALFALFRRNRFEHWTFFKYVETRTRAGWWIRRAYEAFYLFRLNHRIMLQAAGLSLLNMALLTLACHCFGASLGIRTRLVDTFTLFPIITVLAAAPITPGSLGVREGLFVALYGALDVGRAEAILLSLLNYAGGLFWSLFGGLLFMGYSSDSRQATHGEIEAKEEVV